MRYGSICSGIESATVAWHPLGWEPAFFAEIAAFPSALLKHRYPTVPNHGDFTTIQDGDYGAIDLLVGGTPCQDFSVAGLRKGLDGARGALTIEFARLAGRLRPRWLVWENVPGVLSSDGGRAFGIFLGLLGQLGYGFAYRVLDAQYAGVPQRRRRVFLVGHLGDWRRAAAVLFERHSLSGYPAPRRKAGQEVTGTFGSRSTAGGGFGGDFETTGGLIPSTGETAHCLNAGGMGRQDFETETLVTHALRADGFDASEDGTGRGTPLVAMPFDATQIASKTNRSQPGYGNPCHTLHTGAPTVALNLRGRNGGSQLEASDVASLRAADGGSSRSYMQTGMAVRRLTPLECERLQGFPDGYTAVPYRGKPAADGPRYKALGNSKAVPVVRWIGQRIAEVDAL